MSVVVDPQRISYGPGPWQYGDVWRPMDVGTVGAVPVVVLYHGGFWRAAYTSDLMEPLARDLTRRGWAVWNVEYRRVGAGGGGGGWPATYDDARTALAALPGIPGLDPAQVVTCGHSAGGHLAVWAAWRAVQTPTDPRVRPRLAISLSGVLDLADAASRGLGAGAVEDLMGGSPPTSGYRDTSLRDALPLGVAQLVVHAAGDTVVPPQLSADHAIAASAAGDEVEHVVVEGDHMSVIDPMSAAWVAVVDRLSVLTQ